MSRFALVTGASTGIGRAVAVALAERESLVGLVGRDRAGLEETRSLVEGAGGKAEIFITDLAKTSEIDRLLRNIKGKFKKADFLVNGAGIWHGKSEVYADKNLEDFSEEVIMDTFMVGTVGPMLLVWGLVSLMPKKAKIVNISGTFENGAKGWLPYFVSKRAMEDLTVGLAQELAEKDIQVNCVSPSDVATEAYRKYFPQYIDEAVSPEVVAERVAYLCSSKADKISGQVFVVKKGESFREGFHR